MADGDEDWDDEEDEYDEEDERERRRARDLVKQEEMRAAKQRQEAAREEMLARARRKARDDIHIEITAVLGTADVIVNNLLKVGRGAVIELNKNVDEPIELQANGKAVATGEVVVAHDKLAINLLSFYKK